MSEARAKKENSAFPEFLPEDLRQSLKFIETLDQLKQIQRQNLVMDESRRENSAEHSWHISVMAMVLAPYAPVPIDLAKVLKMLLIHDVVEIDAGDTFCYDTQGNADKAEKEQRAADRLFGLLPENANHELRSLWEEFEAGKTAEAQFAASLDRFQTLLQNKNTRGGTWRIHGIPKPRVLERMAPVEKGIPALWPVVEAILEQAVSEGTLSK